MPDQNKFQILNISCKCVYSIYFKNINTVIQNCLATENLWKKAEKKSSFLIGLHTKKNTIIGHKDLKI